MSDEVDELIRQSVDNADIPHIYFNGFAVSVTPSDVLLFLKRVNEPVGVLYISHTMAKTIVDLLGKTLASFEATTGASLATIAEINAKLEKGNTAS